MADDFTGKERQIASSGSVVNLNDIKKWEHWKYPATVGNDTGSDDVNFNSHQSSEYAKLRMGDTSRTTQEPFMLFECMTIDEDKAQAKIKAGARQIQTLKDAVLNFDKGAPGLGTEGTTEELAAMGHQAYDNIKRLGRDIHSGKAHMDANEAIESGAAMAFNKVTGFIKSASTPAERNYTGSIALYMPTDVQINDSMVYNEDLSLIHI